MTDSDRALPTPPRSRFGGPRSGPGEGEGPLTADRMAQAAAAGRLEEFLQHELPEGEHARDLAAMMLGMSGMMPEMPGMPGTAAAPAVRPAPEVAAAAGPDAVPGAAEAVVPPEVVSATLQGDVAGLASLLRAEQARRAGAGLPGESAAPAAAEPCPPRGEATGAPRAGIDAKIVEELVRIAADNDLGVDWLMLRAVRLYVEEYRRTGRL